MEWLTQNWLWVAFGIGMLFMMRRGGHGGDIGGCCGGGQGGKGKPATGDGSQGESKADGAAGHHHYH